MKETGVFAGLKQFSGSSKAPIRFSFASYRAAHNQRRKDEMNVDDTLYLNIGALRRSPSSCFVRHDVGQKLSSGFHGNTDRLVVGDKRRWCTGRMVVRWPTYRCRNVHGQMQVDSGRVPAKRRRPLNYRNEKISSSQK